MAANVKVLCRFRPMNRRERELGCEEIIDLSPDGLSVTIGGKQPFNFDRVFGQNTPQAAVYDLGARPIVEDVLKGFNGTIFAYGQTGSGKTHTMQGPDIHDVELRGIIPRINAAVFAAILAADANTEFLVKVSYFEIYMEKIRDLLDPGKVDLQIRQHPTKGIYVEGITEVYVGGEDEVMAVMDEGARNRKVAETKMNMESSRSHSVFMMTVVQKDLSTGASQRGTLYLVDLAGSEKVAKTGASGQTLDEAKGINKSLSALGNVINALTDGKSKHIPYRDSKLTRILQDSLGGNSRTALIINCSPASDNEAETVSTLRFGIRAKSIKNSPTQNKERSVAELTALLNKANEEITRLKQYLAVMEAELRVLRGDAPPGVALAAAAAAAGAAGGAHASTAVAVAAYSAAAAAAADANGAAAVGAPIVPDLAQLHALRDRIAELESVGERYAEERQNFEDRIDSALSRIQEKEAELDEAQRRFAELTAEHAKAADAVRDFERRTAEASSRAGDLDARVMQAEYALREARLEVESAVEERRLLAEERDEARRQLASAQSASATDAARNSEREMRMQALRLEELQLIERQDELRRNLENDVTRMTTMMEPAADSEAAKTAAEAAVETAIASSHALYAALRLLAPDANLPEEFDPIVLDRVAGLRPQPATRAALLASSSSPIGARRRGSATAPAAAPPPVATAAPALSVITDELEDVGLGGLAVDVDVAAVEVSDEFGLGLGGLDGLVDQLPPSAGGMLDGLDIGLNLDAADVYVGGDSLGIDLSGVNVAVDDVDALDSDGGADAVPSMATEVESIEMESMRATVSQLQDEVGQLRRRNAEMEKRPDGSVASKKMEEDLNKLREHTTRRLEELDKMRGTLLRDLHNRCEKVIELQMELDEARDQYNELLVSTGSKSLLKKVQALEKSLGDTTKSEQEATSALNQLRAQKSIADKKMHARDERIEALENLLKTTQERAAQQAVAFEEEKRVLLSQVMVQQQKLEDLLSAPAPARGRSGSGIGGALAASGGGGSVSGATAGGFARTQGRIARPIRGGGASAATTTPANSSSLAQARASDGGGSDSVDSTDGGGMISPRRLVVADAGDASPSSTSSPSRAANSGASTPTKRGFLSFFSK
jgi:kinesin family protein 5